MIGELSVPAFFALSLGLVCALIAASRPIFGLILLVWSEVAIYLATRNLPLVGMTNGAIVLIMTLGVIPEKRRSPAGGAIRMRTPIDRYFLFLALLGLVYLGVGLARGNDRTYVFGDSYHVLLEMGLPFFLCTIFLRSERRLHRFLRALALGMLILSALILILYATGALQQLRGAGVYYRLSKVWRIRVTANYPLFPLAWLMGVWLFQKAGEGKRMTGFACLALSIVMLLTLKRTLWLAFALLLVFYFFAIGARQRFTAIRSLVAASLLLFGAASILLPNEMLHPEDMEAYTESIGKRFSTRESDLGISFANRIAQFEDAIDVMVRNPLGYGLGSEAKVRFAADGAPLPQHYIHNAFIHYALQMGIAYPILLILLSVKIIRDGLRAFRRMPDGVLKGALLGAVGCYVSILIASLTEIGTNTLFFPMSASCVYLIAARAPHDGGRRHRARDAVRSGALDDGGES
jgi:hypothetical protein